MLNVHVSNVECHHLSLSLSINIYISINLHNKYLNVHVSNVTISDVECSCFECYECYDFEC